MWTKVVMQIIEYVWTKDYMEFSLNLWSTEKLQVKQNLWTKMILKVKKQMWAKIYVWKFEENVIYVKTEIFQLIVNYFFLEMLNIRCELTTSYKVLEVCELGDF
jgi:hypothetical protein